MTRKGSQERLMQEHVQILIDMSVSTNTLVSSAGLSMCAIVSSKHSEDGTDPTPAIGVDVADVRLLELAGYIKVKHRGEKVTRYELTAKGQTYINPKFRKARKGNNSPEFHNYMPFVFMVRNGKYAKWFSPEITAAGLQLHYDFELMVKPEGSPKTFNWSLMNVPSKVPTHNYIPNMWFSVEAVNRFERAMRVAGPILADVLLSIVCHGRGLEDTEKMLDIPTRSGKISLIAALWQLHHFYKGEPDLAVIC